MDTMILSDAVDLLLNGDISDAQALIVEHDPFVPAKVHGRKYSEIEKIGVMPSSAENICKSISGYLSTILRT
ncbi:MAG: hypothetical protein SO100_01110 [Dysosmobacter sp.]|nr:hypothetical protein [Dysosmobacter sp.]